MVEESENQNQNILPVLDESLVKKSLNEFSEETEETVIKTCGSNRITKNEAQQSMLNRKQKKLVHRLNTSYCRTGKMERILPILMGKSKISLRLIDWFVTNYAKIFNTHYNLNEYKNKRESRGKKNRIPIAKTHKKDLLKEKEKEKEKLKEKELLITSIPIVIPIIPVIGTSPSNHIIEGTTPPLNPPIALKDQYFNDLFFVYPSYRQELKTNSKKRFDVFCRNGSFNYYYDDNKFIETNDGQLNFFDWADNMYVIDFIEEHYTEIERDMELRNSKKPLSLKKGKKANTIACDKDLESVSQKQRRKRREISESSLKTVHHIQHKSIISFD